MKANGARGTWFWRSGPCRPVEMLLFALLLCLAPAVPGWSQTDQSREDFTTPTPQKLQKSLLLTAKIPPSTADTATATTTPPTSAAPRTGAGSGGASSAPAASGTTRPGSSGSSPWRPIIDNVRKGIDAVREGGSGNPPDRPSSRPGGSAVPAGKWIQRVTVPDVRGKSRAEADAALSAKGLSMQVTERYDDSPRGRVFHQEPGPNQLTDQGTGVAVKVSRGPRPVAVATGEQEKPAESGRGRVVRKEKVAGQPRPDPGQAGISRRLGWEWVAGGVAFLIGCCILVVKYLKSITDFINAKLFPPKLRLGASHQGVILEIALPEGDQPDWEVGVRPVLDRGTQEITEGG